jgi:hypothetical protein
MILLLYKAKKKKPNRLLTSFHEKQQRHSQRAEISRLKSLKCATATTARVRTNKLLQNTDTDTALWEREREREREREEKTSSTGHTNECFGRRKAQIWEKEHNPMRRWVTAAGNEAERAQKMTRERGQDTRGGAQQSSLVSSLSLSLLARLSSLPLAGLFAVDGDGRWRSRCRSLPGDYNCSLDGWMDGWIDGSIIYYD